MNTATLAYATVGSNQLEAAKRFYDALLASAGILPLMEHDPAAGVYRLPGGGMFAVVGPYNGQSATVGNGTMIGFALESHAAVDAFHAKALELGGTDEGAPGPRGPAEAKAYMAYMRDLDGNKLSAFKLG